MPGRSTCRCGRSRCRTDTSPIVVDLDDAPPLSARATAGFLNRAERSTLNFADGFLADMAQHAALMSGERAVA